MRACPSRKFSAYLAALKAYSFVDPPSRGRVLHPYQLNKLHLAKQRQDPGFARPRRTTGNETEVENGPGTEGREGRVGGGLWGEG